MTHLMGRELVFVDTETDSLARTAQGWEFALIKGDEHLHLMVGIDTSLSDPDSLKFGHYHQRHPNGDEFTGDTGGAQYIPARRAAQMIAEFTRDVHLVGANVGFDVDVISNLLEKHGQTPAWNYHKLDIEAVAIGWLIRNGHTLPSAWKSDDLAQMCGVVGAGEDRHTAMGDAQWVRRWWDAIR